MKIAFIITGLGMGGAETQIISLADYFALHGHLILIVSMRGDAVVLPQHPSIKLVSLHMNATPVSFFSAYCRVRRMLIEFSPDVVHSHLVHANIFARLLRITTVFHRLICSSHSSYEGGFARGLAYRITDGLSDMNTNVSNDAVKASILRGHVKERKIIVVHNGIDCNNFYLDIDARKRLRSSLNVAEDTHVLIAVGRFTKAKDYPNLLKAAAIVFAKHQNSVLWIVGAGDERQLFKAIAEQLGIGEKVIFLGLRRDIAGLMNAADIFVLSSAWEGFGLVVAEAMACERVVVATDCGGVREVIGSEGILAPPRDSIALANSLNKALEFSCQKRAVVGRAARRRILQCFSLSSAAERWLDIYRGKFQYGA